MKRILMKPSVGFTVRQTIRRLKVVTIGFFGAAVLIMATAGFAAAQENDQIGPQLDYKKQVPGAIADAGSTFLAIIFLLAIVAGIVFVIIGLANLAGNKGGSGGKTALIGLALVIIGMAPLAIFSKMADVAKAIVGI